MRRFLYFFPGIPGINPTMLKERGVIDRLTLRPGGDKLIEWTVTGVMNGPSGSGCIVAAGPRPPGPGSRWLEGKDFWVGIEDEAPGPEDLVREIGIAGHELALCDGNLWRIPLVRRWNEQTLAHESNVPNFMAPTLVGGRYRYGRQVRPEFASLDALAEWVFTACVREVSLPIEQVMEKAAQLLAVNYRIGIEEAGLLGLLDESNAVEALKLCADIRRIQSQAAEMQTKGIEFTEPTITEE